VFDQLTLNLTNSEHGAFKNLLDITALLRLYHLVIALLKLSVDVDVLDVKAGQVLEDFIFGPGKLNVRLSSSFINLSGHLFDLLLLLKIVHGVLPLQVVSNVRHILL
jgi:hypothetical protein